MRRAQVSWGMKPRRTVLSPGLERWLAEATPAERRTAVVRPRISTDVGEAAATMSATGAEVQSAGPAAIVCVLTPGALRQVVEQPWVLSVEEPSRLFPRGRSPSLGPEL